MRRVYHSSAMLLGDKWSGIVFFTAVCIIRGNMCRQTFQNVQRAGMGLAQLDRSSFQPVWTWHHGGSSLQVPGGPSRSGIFAYA